MHSAQNELPIVFEGEGVVSRQIEWGNMNVALESFPAGTDTEPIFKGLPDDRCQCPHWGFVLKGQLRVRYKDHEETIRAGEIYYLAPGHLPIFDEDTTTLEFSPLHEYQKTMEVAERNVAALMAAGANS